METAITAIETKINTFFGSSSYVLHFTKTIQETQNAWEFLYHTDKEVLIKMEKRVVEILHKAVKEKKLYSCNCDPECEFGFSVDDYKKSRIEMWEKYDSKYKDFSTGLDMKKLAQNLWI